jgi:hypothetical protein
MNSKSQKTAETAVNQVGQRQLTSLARKLDFRLWSNRFAVAVTLAAGIIAALLQAPIVSVISSAAWAFFSWALARELDPDAPLTAAIASAAVLVLILLSPEARAMSLEAFLVTGLLVQAARVSLNSTGYALSKADEIMTALAPLLVSIVTRQLPVAILGISSLLALLSRRASRVPLGLAALGLFWLIFEPVHVQLSIAFWVLLLMAILQFWRPVPISSADNGQAFAPESWRWMHIAVWAGALLGALMSPWLLWFSVAMVGFVALMSGWSKSS